MKLECNCGRKRHTNLDCGVPIPDAKEIRSSSGEIADLRARLAAAEAREAALRDTLRSIAPHVHHIEDRSPYETCIDACPCCRLDAALADPSPRADAILRVVEAAREADATLCECRYYEEDRPAGEHGCNCDIHAAHRILRDALAALEAANG